MVTLSLGFMLISILTAQQLIHLDQTTKPGYVQKIGHNEYRYSICIASILSAIISIGFAITLNSEVISS